MVNWVGVFSRGREGTYKNVGVEKKGVGQKPKNKKKVTSSMYFLWLTYYNLGRAFHLEGRNFLERLRRLNHHLTARSCCY